MNLLNNILSSIDPTAVNQLSTPAARKTQSPGVSTPAQRQAGAANGTSQAQPLKRKAEGQPAGGQVKIQRKDAPGQPERANGSTRPAPTPGVTTPKPPAPPIAVPYRGTAGLGAARASNIVAKKPAPVANPPIGISKPATPTPKNPGVAPAPGAAPAATKKGGYAAMLQRAKEAQQAKPPAPPVKHEATKMLTKKERLALRAEASAIAKGKKPNSTGPARVTDLKSDVNKEKRKPADLGYQGTARPAKKPADIGYKGTARPATVPAGATGRAGGPAAAKAKPKPNPGRYGGYASWSEEELEEEDEDDGASDASSDMEAGIWDVEHEDELALKVAKKEDAEALAEENELKRQKEERKRKLMAMSKAAAAKRKY